MARELLRRQLVRLGAWLFVIGLITGLWAAAVLTEQVKAPIPRLALAAHLNGLLGDLWLIAVASTLDLLRYGDRGLRRLAWLVTTAAWGNWLITLVASVLGVRGLEYTNDPANNAVAALLQAFVVLPSLLGAGAWAVGMRPRAELVR